MRYYPAIFTPDTEVGGYTVTFPDLEGCVTEGDNVEDAFEMAQEALTGYIEVYLESDQILPIPTEPHTLTPPSGGFISIVPLRNIKNVVGY
jgi:predicted RNase H-like HicB family nuclease